MKRCATIALLCLAGAAPLEAAVDFATTQGGSNFGFGGRDEIAINISDQMLANTNTFLAGGRGPLADLDGGPLVGEVSEPDLGQIINLGGNVRGVLDRMAAKQTLWLLFVDDARMPWCEPEPWLGASLPRDIVAGFMLGGGTGGGSEGSGTNPGDDGDPPIVLEEDPEDTPLRTIAAPEPSVAAGVTVAMLALARGRRKRRTT